MSSPRRRKEELELLRKQREARKKAREKVRADAERVDEELSEERRAKERERKDEQRLRKQHERSKERDREFKKSMVELDLEEERVRSERGMAGVRSSVKSLEAKATLFKKAGDERKVRQASHDETTRERERMRHEASMREMDEYASERRRQEQERQLRDQARERLKAERERERRLADEEDEEDRREHERAMRDLDRRDREREREREARAESKRVEAETKAEPKRILKAFKAMGKKIDKGDYKAFVLEFLDKPYFKKRKLGGSSEEGYTDIDIHAIASRLAKAIEEQSANVPWETNEFFKNLREWVKRVDFGNDKYTDQVNEIIDRWEIQAFYMINHADNALTLQEAKTEKSEASDTLRDWLEDDAFLSKMMENQSVFPNLADIIQKCKKEGMNKSETIDTIKDKLDSAIEVVHSQAQDVIKRLDYIHAHHTHLTTEEVAGYFIDSATFDFCQLEYEKKQLDGYKAEHEDVASALYAQLSKKSGAGWIIHEEIIEEMDIPDDDKDMLLAATGIMSLKASETRELPDKDEFIEEVAKTYYRFDKLTSGKPLDISTEQALVLELKAAVLQEENKESKFRSHHDWQLHTRGKGNEALLAREQELRMNFMLRPAANGYDFRCLFAKITEPRKVPVRLAAKKAPRRRRGYADLSVSSETSSASEYGARSRRTGLFGSSSSSSEDSKKAKKSTRRKKASSPSSSRSK